MRPVDKGICPYTVIKDYSEALPYLEQRIGCYCSYCEMLIEHVPEVEHIIAKDCGGSRTAWSNLLLACKYCNSRKKTIIGENPKERWLWPDEDNTYLAFKYDLGLPKLNDDYLRSKDDLIYSQARNIFTDLCLDNIPRNANDKDRRYKNRNNAYNRAKDALSSWNRAKDTDFEDDFKKSICVTAKAMGFFSVWMNVFEDEPMIRVALIHAFEGTALDCFDLEGLAISRPSGKI